MYILIIILIKCREMLVTKKLYMIRYSTNLFCMAFIKFYCTHLLRMTWCFHIWIYYSYTKKCITGYSFFVTRAPKIYSFSSYLEWNTALITNIVNYVSRLLYHSYFLVYFPLTYVFHLPNVLLYQNFCQLLFNSMFLCIQTFFFSCCIKYLISDKHSTIR